MWMTVALATFRYIFVCKHTLAQKLCTVRRAYICVVLVAVATLALCIPYMLCYEIGPTPSSFQHNVTHLWITQTKMCTKNDGVLETFTFLIAGGVLKTGACVVLLFFTITLVVALYKVKQKREAIQQKQQSKSKEREHNRTTVMLIAVVLSFGIAELPQGILVLACTGNDWFFKEVYRYLGDILDTITLFNTSFNFVLYTTMSQKFRDTFYIKLIRPVKRILPCVNKQYQDVRQTDEDWQLTKNATKLVTPSATAEELRNPSNLTVTTEVTLANSENPKEPDSKTTLF
ncbi:dmsr-8 [Bugula neritina]|uniref:Dmsr-8 n=1 Tax=Bugula neritina TaxID=10212 RepID=A0A7J7J4N4_BUGNE|nr:dmsr-8 [Bugula neritina]